MATSGWGRVIGLVAILLYWPLDASALSLGELSLFSALNEPFYAEIPLSSVSENDLKTLRARVVDRPDFDAPGFQRGLLSPVRVSLVSEGDRHFLRIRSDHGVYEPFVRFFLQVDWAGGRLQREFTALIDPRAPGEAPVLSPAESEAARGQPKVTEVDVSTPPSPTPRAEGQGSSQITAVGMAKATTEEKPAAPPLSKATEPAQAKPPVKVPDRDAEERSRAAQRERIESEIRAWAEERQQDRREGTAEDQSSAQAREEEAKAVAAAPAAPATPPRSRAPAPSRPAESTAEPTLGGWIAQNWGRLVTLLMLVIGGAVLTVALALAFVLYKRQRSAAGALEELELQPEPDDGVALLQGKHIDERRGGPGRRRRFVPAAVERRQELRRSSDRVQAAPPVYPVEGDTTEEVNRHMAVGQNDQAERVLRAAIGRQPWRHGLKVKLLGVLYKQGKRDAVETLINQLYVAMEDEGKGDALAKAADLEDADTVLMDGQERGPAEPVEPRLETPRPVAPEVIEYRTKGEGRDPEAPLAEAMEALELELPHVNADVVEREMEVLDMDVPKGEDEPTHLIMAGADTPDRAASAGERSADSDRDAQADAESISLAREKLEDIRSAVARGIELLPERSEEEGAVSGDSEKGRSHRGGRRGKRQARSTQETRTRWQDPAIRIDLAKAYIDMGDMERARRILEEVLEAWHSGDGGRG